LFAESISSGSVMCRTKVRDITDIFLLFCVKKIPVIYELIKFVGEFSVSFTEIIFVKREILSIKKFFAYVIR